MFVRRGTTTLKAVVLRVLVPRLAVFILGALVLALGHTLGHTLGDALGHAPGPGVSTGSSTTTSALTLSKPSWSATDAWQHPECTPAAQWLGGPAPYVVVQAVRDRLHSKLSFDRAWQLNHNATEVDDVWVLGVCG